MVVAALATCLLSLAESYGHFLFAGIGIGIAGGAFAAGISYISRFYPPQRRSAALGIFGTSNVGAAVTALLAPLVMAAMGWQTVVHVWAAALLILAILFLITTRDDPETAARRRDARKPVALRQQLEALRNLQVWRFSLYYFFVFGAFVALALWLPRYLIGVYGLDIATAGALAAIYIIRSEEHTSELQSLMRNSYAVFCLKK